MSVSVTSWAVRFCTSASVTSWAVRFQDPSLEWADRVEDLVGRLTLEEIVAQTMAIYQTTVPPIPRSQIVPTIQIVVEFLVIFCSNVQLILFGLKGRKSDFGFTTNYFHHYEVVPKNSGTQHDQLSIARKHFADDSD